MPKYSCSPRSFLSCLCSGLFGIALLISVTGAGHAAGECRLGSAELTSGELVILPGNGVVLECAEGSGWVFKRTMRAPAPAGETGKPSGLVKQIQQFLRNAAGEGQCSDASCAGLVNDDLRNAIVDYMLAELDNTIEPSDRFAALWGTKEKTQLAAAAGSLSDIDLLHAFYVTVMANGQ